MERGGSGEREADFRRPGRILVVGGANLDVKARAQAAIEPATSNPGSVVLSPGGVGRNVAHALALFGEDVALVSVVGRDAAGESVLAATASAGVDCSLVRRTDQPTGVYVAVLHPGGELAVGVSGMEALTALTPGTMREIAPEIASSGLVVADANLSADALLALGRACAGAGVPLAVEPVSVPKAARLLPLLEAGVPLALATPNRDELAVLAGLPAESPDAVARAAEALHARGVRRLLVGLGPEGVLACEPGRSRILPRPDGPVADVTGGGDAALAAAIAALRRGAGLVQAAAAGQQAASAAVSSSDTVPQALAGILSSSLSSETPSSRSLP